MRNVNFLAFGTLFLFSLTASAFPSVGKLKIPEKPKGNAEDVNKFIKSSDAAYTDVNTLSADVPTQITELADEILGLKDMPVDAACKEKYEGLKQEIAESAKIVKSPKVHQVQPQKEAHQRLDQALTNLNGFMKETLATEGAQKALVTNDLGSIKSKGQSYLEKDLAASKTIGEKLLESGKLAPAASVAYGIGLADDYTAELQDGAKVKRDELKDFVKSGADNVNVWKGFTQNKVDALTAFLTALGVK